MKKCTKCGEIKHLSEFNFRKESSDNLTSWCKLCLSVKNKNWSIKNTDYLRKKRKDERIKNPEKFKIKFNKWYHENNKQQLLRAKTYRENNKEKIKISMRNWCRKKRQADLNYKILLILRNRINNVIKRQNGKKAFSAINLTGCTVDKLKLHLESKFKPGMNWQNHSVYGWHIDHIIPCASFDLTDPEQQKKCFHYTNLQPLWAKDNISKGAKIS